MKIREGDFLKRLKIILASIWLSVASYFSAGWIAFTYMCITGHSKGYAYNLGSEKSVSVLWGMGMLGIWLIAVVPATIWLCIKCYRCKKPLILLPFVGFALLFISAVYFMGFNKFIGYFGAGPTPFY